MDEDVAVILDDPEVVAFPLGTEELVPFRFHLLQYVVGDGPYLGGVGRIADDEIVGNGPVDAPEVEGYDVFPLFVQDGIGYQPEVMGDHILSFSYRYPPTYPKKLYD